MKFLIDVCVSHHVVNYLESVGYEVTLVSHRDPRLGDEDILEWAAREGSVLVTNDKDFGRHVFLHQKPHAGLVRLPSAHGDMLVALMREALRKHHEDLQAGAILTLTRRRIRVRRKPHF